ncbi:YqiA/YcfP family alpha/beta fold hydrolase [Sulfurovum sp.]|uniref:YqiA/YcfP family alpha/beta fold hydrolase n=1 Tax=Sulfurovum sp. TaxID=1969726 RepID=UPI0025D20C2A|nr:YqiA/YcfP family alpha/beta fold hydrolase [Sulfurovum sp.]
MIIYIHGFGSHGYGGKASAFRDYFKNKGKPFIAPSLSYVPELAMQTLEELIGSYHEEIKLIGSSLGGYYTLYLAQKYQLKAVLINPAIRPYITLKRALGDAPNFYDGSHFEWKETHLEMLKTYETGYLSKERNFMLMLQKGDDVLDYKEAIAKLPKAKQITEDGGSHSFDGIEHYFEKIEHFLE